MRANKNIVNNILPVAFTLCVLLSFSDKIFALSPPSESVATPSSLSQPHRDPQDTHKIADNKAKYQLAIIIDDIGAKASDAKAFSLSKDITFSILPHTKYSTQFSYRASQQNREVMLHMPMESLNKENLGPGPLLSTMYPREVKSALLNALKTVPHAVGVNNHMGSKLTQMTLQMKTLMHQLGANNLFFVDSRTTRFTKAMQIAKLQGVKTASRHVFLDHVQKADFLDHQFRLAIKRAKRHKKAILIAHPYPVTLKYLAENLPYLPKDIELITVSEYLQETDKFRINPRLAMASSSPVADPVTNDEAPLFAPQD
jgi:polysaccharide deacetylase 2 family uncharacterized protein YibQ